MYIIYSDEDLMKEVHCKSCTVDKLKNELVEFDLLSMEDILTICIPYM